MVSTVDPGPPVTGPTMILCAHGTNDPLGRATVERIAALVAAARPGVRVELAFVDVQEPRVADMVARTAARGERSVVLPLLLGNGFHAQVDIVEAIRGRPARAAAPLGPEPSLGDLMATRLIEAGVTEDEAVVVAAAGSSRPEAVEDARTAMGYLAACWDGPVAVGFCSAARPSVATAVEVLRERTGQRVIIAPYLIGPGYFQSLLLSAGADLVVQPLGVHPILIRRVLASYDEACAAATVPLTA